MVYFENGISNILDSLVLESNGFDFTLFCYDEKIENVFKSEDIINIINTKVYNIAYSFQTAHDLLSIAYDDNYISEEKIRRDLKMVCDELDLILENE